MIDITSEQVASLNEAAKWSLWPRRRKGKKPHVATIYRWAKQGCRGVRLEAIRVGGTVCTSREAVQRFCDRLTAIDNGEPGPPTPTHARKASIRRAEETLRRAGILPSEKPESSAAEAGS